jgi:hypothetical protein
MNEDKVEQTAVKLNQNQEQTLNDSLLLKYLISALKSSPLNLSLSQNEVSTNNLSS